MQLWLVISADDSNRSFCGYECVIVKINPKRGISLGSSVDPFNIVRNLQFWPNMTTKTWTTLKNTGLGV